MFFILVVFSRKNVLERLPGIVFEVIFLLHKEKHNKRVFWNPKRVQKIILSNYTTRCKDEC